jgi:hypothetical protein
MTSSSYGTTMVKIYGIKKCRDMFIIYLGLLLGLINQIDKYRRHCLQKTLFVERRRYQFKKPPMAA